MDASIEVKYISVYVQENGIIRIASGKRKNSLLGRITDNVTYYELEEENCLIKGKI